MNDVAVGAICGAVGAAVTGITTYLGMRSKTGADIVLAGWVQISKEQAEFRKLQRKELQDLSRELSELRAENERLSREVAILKIRNIELSGENERLEARVNELETELGEYRVKATSQTKVAGL